MKISIEEVLHYQKAVDTLEEAEGYFNDNVDDKEFYLRYTSAVLQSRYLLNKLLSVQVGVKEVK